MPAKWGFSVVLAAFVFAMAGVALADTINCDGGACAGTNGDDVIYGTAQVDFIYTKEGSDRPVWGYGGNDDLFGDKGYDTLRGGDNADEVFGDENGTSSWDRVIGGDGHDDVYDRWVTPHFIEADAGCGLDGNDKIDVQDGTETSDKYHGGAGDDQFIVNGVDEHVGETSCTGD